MANNDNEFSRAVLDAAAGDDIDQLVKAVAMFPHLIDAQNINHWRNDTPMHVAAAKGKVLVIETLIRLGSKAIDSPNKICYTPLYSAAETGHVPAIEALVRLGSKAIDTPNKYGMTPLFAAAVIGRASVIEALVRSGSKAIDTPDDSGRTPMRVAAGYATVVRTLVAVGALPFEGFFPTITEDEVTEVRYRVYFSHSFVHRLLTSSSIDPGE